MRQTDLSVKPHRQPMGKENDTTGEWNALIPREDKIMDPVSVTPVLIEEDLRLTAYRLEVARNMPQDPYRDALIAGLASRLSRLSEAGVLSRTNVETAGRGWF
jgi:hypothetical protein